MIEFIVGVDVFGDLFREDLREEMPGGRGRRIC